ncbi:zinc finger protein ZAT11-like [Nicotiana tabacum]|uniref:Zinc finger protein ZAT11-like n=1 Tax=Nicotiana tabacum TaxID=4097 RepID=A0A1S4D523_TOBAC|nr:zinc finger protein ZAT11-like [Nicotiana tomentosiformis]XP_016508476.1 PREDICTED: zinc finger protein ZAT11-like [Nicotiana tabacum]
MCVCIDYRVMKQLTLFHSDRFNKQYTKLSICLCLHPFTMKRSREEDSDVEALAMANCSMLLSRLNNNTIKTSSFECKTCNKRFSSFQALGGHRTSHKSLRSSSIDARSKSKKTKNNNMHQCCICGMEFFMGQALGGHMRCHRAPINVPVLNNSNSSSKRILCLDLNLTPDDQNDDFKLWPTAPAPVLRCFI